MLKQNDSKKLKFFLILTTISRPMYHGARILRSVHRLPPHDRFFGLSFQGLCTMGHRYNFLTTSDISRGKFSLSADVAKPEAIRGKLSVHPAGPGSASQLSLSYQTFDCKCDQA